MAFARMQTDTTAAPEVATDLGSGTTEGKPMALFTAEAFQNQYLSDGATDVHAIVRIDATGAAASPVASGQGAAEVIIVDTRSMGERGIREGSLAAAAPSRRSRTAPLSPLLPAITLPGRSIRAHPCPAPR
jgi:hypothetical protein